MEAEYDSTDRQPTVQAELEQLFFQTFMHENEIYSLPEGFTRIVDQIKALTPQPPLLFRDEQHKI